MRKKTVEPKPIDPFNTGLVLNKLQSAIDELCYVSLQFRPSEKANLTNMIARMALAIHKHPENDAAKQELETLLKTYEQRYGWMNDGLWE